MLSEKHMTTLQSRLGTADELIDNKIFRPMFRNRQINHPELFAFSEHLARKKKHPSKYFAKIWGNKQLSKTVSWLSKLVNQAKSKSAEVMRSAKNVAREASIRSNANHAGLQRLQQMRKSFNLTS